MKVARTLHKRIIVLAFVAALLALPTALLACGKSETDLTGTWAGEARVGRGPEKMAFNFTQNDASLSGTFTHESGDSGDLTGQVNGDSVTVTLLKATAKDCNIDFRGMLQGEDKIIGTLQFSSPCDEVTGVFDISRQ